nr:leucine-rich repeat domain-containing protein [Prevotella sp.]
MKKRILLSMILLALCLIQASADTYYFRILLTNENGQPGEWSDYIKVDAVPDGVDVNGQPKYKYPNGLGTLLNGGTVKDNENPEHSYTLPKKADNNEEVNLDRIYGIEFANGRGKDNKSAQQNIMEGNDYEAWKKIRSRIKYLSLRYYIRDTYNDNSYLADMFNVEELELPKDGMKVGNEDNDGQYYFASAHNLKKITIWNGAKAVDITDNTDDVVKKKKLLNIVGKYMFANCWNLSPKYINRLIEGVTEIKNNAFFVNDNDRDKPSDKTKMAIEIPSSVTKIGDQAFLNRLKDTGLNILGNGSLNIGIEAFKACDELAKIQTPDNRVLRISKNAFMLCKQLNAFENIDNAKITSLGEGVFRDCRSMTNEFVKGVLENYAVNGEKKIIPAYLFSGCNGEGGYVCSFTQLDIPASFTQIDKGAFANNPNVTKIIVHRGEQINAQSYDGENGIFYNMVPNKVQVVFKDEADAHYKVYRENIKVGGEDMGKNAFMHLLTKTLDENDEDYTVVAQRHADVCLKRTFKAGWNTLVLPFGARHGDGREDGAGDCAHIFQKALNASNDGNFMIAAYRGLAKNDAHPDNSTFYFLKYANYDDPIDEFEPLLIRMTQKDIDNANANKGVYTFKDVELNYDGDIIKDTYTEYSAAEAIKRMGKRNDDGEYFDGSYDHEANDKFKKCTYKDFYFTGTLYKQTGIATEGSAFIAPGDYIIQNNTFVKCSGGKNYGLKGFRGYFKKQKSLSSSPAKGNIGISLVDRNGVVSSIHQVDGTSLTPASVAPAAVYNLSGQQVGNSLSTLAKGVYIVNGKKFVKK